MRLSVVMPNYNDHINFLKLIPKINSYLTNQDEIIFIDDGSTDESYEKIKNFVCKNNYKNIKIYKNKINMGVVETENFGARLSAGEFLYFAASDDDICPEFFDVCINSLNKYKNAGLCSTRSYLEYPGGTKIVLPLVQPINRIKYLNPKRCLQYLTNNENWISGNSCIYRTSVFIKEGGFRKELEGFCDVTLTIQIPLKYGAVFIPNIMTVFRLSNTSYASKHFKIENINSTLKIIKNIKNILSNESSYILANNWYERIMIQTLVSVSIKELIFKSKKLDFYHLMLSIRSLLKILSLFILNKYLYIYLKKTLNIKFQYAKNYFFNFLFKQNKDNQWML